MKRLAARASLQRPYDQQIMTPRQLFDWAAENVPDTFFQYCSLDDYKKEAWKNDSSKHAQFQELEGSIRSLLYRRPSLAQKSTPLQVVRKKKESQSVVMSSHWKK